MIHASRNRLLTTTLLAGATLFAMPAMAQVAPAPSTPPAGDVVTPAPTPADPSVPVAAQPDAPVAAAAPEAPRDTIVVTGSRIASPNITSLAPVQVVGEAEIDQSGAINVQEVLLENPVFGTPGLSRTNSAFLTSGAGVATVDLRDLGSDRTLILINGRRVVSGLSGSSTVDLNVIPTQFVERVDILTGGASSLYGSDAVAGVVNFLYKRRFSGLIAEGQYGVTSRGDSARYQVSMTGGGNFADDRGNVMVHLGYTNEKGLLSRQRKSTRVDDIAEITYSYDPDDFGVERAPFLSSFPEQGRFVSGNRTFTFSPDGVLQPCFTTNNATCTAGGVTGTGPNGFNRQNFRTLAVPVQRYIFATRGTFEVAPSINVIAEGTYVKTSSQREIEPFALDSADVFPVTGRAPIQTLVNGVPTFNPFVPAAIAANSTDTDGDGLRDIGFGRRLTELGTRNSTATRDFYRFVVGLEGKVLNDRFNWDITYNYGQTSEQQTSNGQPNILNFAQALNAVVDVNDLDNDGSTTDAICADATARAQGCVPINIFGLGSITPEAARYVAAEQTLQSNIKQQVVAANLSGTVVELPAGPLGIAVGAEYRKESSSENNDALTNAGLNAGNALPDTAGKFNVKEIYGELNVPVLKDIPGIHSLNLRAAGRLSDYSTVGSVKTYSIGADWTPIEDVRIRGTYAKAVRAPNIGELFTGPSQTFPTGISDPCVGVTATSTGTAATQCRLDAGVLANIAANGAFTVTQADKQGISGFNSGNPDLAVERSRSITGGIVINPRSINMLRNLVLSVDYYNIKIKDAIVAPPRAFILNQCFQEANQAFCDLVFRRQVASGSNSAGSIEFINAPSVNGGALKSEGIDFVATYNTNLSQFVNGLKMNARFAYTRLLDGFVIPIPGAPKDPFKGEIGDAKNRWNASLGFKTEKVGLSFTGTYIGESFEDDQYIDRINAAREAFDIGPAITKHDIAIKHEFYLDSQLTFTPAPKFEFYVGVDNLLDNKAPKLLSGTTFNITGSDTAADVYDIFGRRYYAGARLKF
jgi:outer membrane receptor protein involved in Fe transport